MRKRTELAAAICLSIVTMFYWTGAGILACPWLCPADSDGQIIRRMEQASVGCFVLAGASLVLLAAATGAIGRRWSNASVVAIMTVIAMAAVPLFRVPGAPPSSMSLAAIAAEAICVLCFVPVRSARSRSA